MNQFSSFYHEFIVKFGNFSLIFDTLIQSIFFYLFICLSLINVVARLLVFLPTTNVFWIIVFKLFQLRLQFVSF